jgi:hypothetical protein
MVMFSKVGIECFNGIPQGIPTGQLPEQNKNELIPTLQ